MDSVIVIDPGSHSFRAGYAYAVPSSEEPRLIAPSLLQVSPSNDPRQELSDASRLLRPIQQGQIVDFAGLESLIHSSIYNQLGWPIGDEGAIVFCEPLLTPRSDREQLTQLMFEVFNVNGLYVQDQATLTLYALGKLTGCVVDIGYEKSDIATVTDGQVNQHSVRRLPYGSLHLSHLLAHLLQQRQGEAVSTQPSSHSSLGLGSTPAQWLMEQCCSVAESEEECEQQAGPPSLFCLPDGQQISVGSEGRMAAEALLRPALLATVLGDPALSAPLGLSSSGQQEPGEAASCPGLPEVVVECVGSVYDVLNKRAGHIKDVCVCGGGSLLPGLAPRLLREVRGLAPPEPLPLVCSWPEYLQ
ncbi:hypothetical protein QJQ45_014755, partial [Haematococcus lacustris]